jgi:tRNA modification GTPase
VADSDFILLMLDGSRELDTDDLEIFREVNGKKRVVIINKNDLPLKISIEEMKNRFKNVPIVLISTLKKEGIDDLKKTIYNSLVHRDVRATPEHLIVANIRHKTTLTQVRDNLSNVAKGLEEGISLEFIAFEFRSALDALGELVGETVTEEVLNRIFEKFCIGK